MRWRIRYQLLVPSLLLFVGVSGVSVWMAFDSADRARNKIETRVRDAAQNVIEKTNYPLTADVLAQMKRIAGPDYDYLVTLPTGTPVSTLSELPQELPPPDSLTDDWKTLRLGPLIQAGGQTYLCGGIRLRPPRTGETLYILYPETRWRTALWEALQPVFVLGGSFGVAAAALALVLGQRMSRRLRELERRTRLIAAGDFSPMPLPSPNDEIRDLTRSVNEMAERLAQFQETTRRTERLRLLGQVSGGLAHQLRNGVTGARLAVQLFIQENQTSAEATDTSALEVALRQLTVMETSLKRLLDLGRGGELRFAECSLTAMVNDVVDLVRPRCRHAGIEMFWQPPDDPYNLRADTGQIGQMILNVLGNAIEAAGPGGKVEVKLLPPAGTVAILEISDNGPGPTPEIADRLFEPFATSKPEGVGLGLAVARQVAEAHGGRISWRREKERTCFRIELKLR